MRPRGTSKQENMLAFLSILKLTLIVWKSFYFGPHEVSLTLLGFNPTNSLMGLNVTFVNKTENVLKIYTVFNGLFYFLVK